MHPSSLFRPSVSVIIPAFNGQEYLAEALASVAAQSHPDLEIIVVDDGSTDRTAEIAQTFDDRRVRYVYASRSGAALARNRGVGLARGELLAFLDADDVWTHDKLRLQVASLERGDGDMIFTRVEQFVGPNPFQSGAPQQPPTTGQPGICATTLLMRREAFERVGFFDGECRLGEFLDWYARAVDLGLKPAVLPEALAGRRVHETNQGRGNRDRASEYARVMKRVLDRRRRSPGQPAARHGT